jgi:hypothetical protein
MPEYTFPVTYGDVLLPTAAKQLTGSFPNVWLCISGSYPRSYMYVLSLNVRRHNPRRDDWW